MSMADDRHIGFHRNGLLQWIYDGVNQMLVDGSEKRIADARAVCEQDLHNFLPCVAPSGEIFWNQSRLMTARAVNQYAQVLLKSGELTDAKRWTDWVLSIIKERKSMQFNANQQKAAYDRGMLLQIEREAKERIQLLEKYSKYDAAKLKSLKMRWDAEAASKAIKLPRSNPSMEARARMNAIAGRTAEADWPADRQGDFFVHDSEDEEVDFDEEVESHDEDEDNFHAELSRLAISHQGDKTVGGGGDAAQKPNETGNGKTKSQKRNERRRRAGKVAKASGSSGKQ